MAPAKPPQSPEEPSDVAFDLLWKQPRFRYRAIACKLFLGEWRAEPVNYTGRGIVYHFHGKDAKLDARAWADKKNSELS